MIASADFSRAIGMILPGVTQPLVPRKAESRPVRLSNSFWEYCRRIPGSSMAVLLGISLDGVQKEVMQTVVMRSSVDISPSQHPTTFVFVFIDEPCLRKLVLWVHGRHTLLRISDQSWLAGAVIN